MGRAMSGSGAGTIIPQAIMLILQNEIPKDPLREGTVSYAVEVGMDMQYRSAVRTNGINLQNQHI